MSGIIWQEVEPKKGEDTEEQKEKRGEKTLQEHLCDQRRRSSWHRLEICILDSSSCLKIFQRMQVSSQHRASNPWVRGFSVQRASILSVDDMGSNRDGPEIHSVYV